MAGYISKDFIHYGCGLLTDPATVIKKVPYSVRKNIKKAEKSGIVVRKAEGSPADINILRNMWYDPADPNIPVALKASDFMFIAENEGLPVGICVLLPVGRHLFLNNLAGNARGKQMRVQDYLLWHCVNYFADSEYDYIDVGVSYRPSLYNFFKKWQTFTYPIIFNKPKIHLPINLNPFMPERFLSRPEISLEMETIRLLQTLTDVEMMTFVPDLECVNAICSAMNVEMKDITFDFPMLNKDMMSFISLPDIFSCQFGAVIFNLGIGDAEMWDRYQCLDVLKRSLSYSIIHQELVDFDKLVRNRNDNYEYIKMMFVNDDIRTLDGGDKIRQLFRFVHDEHLRYHKKLLEFGIEHKYDRNTGEIGLPVHQNLRKDHLDYMYAVFRGVLNLCSEWVHTDNYDNYKPL